MNEFELIRQYFSFSAASSAEKTAPVTLGVGDDCALLALSQGHHLAVTTDTLISDVHFLADASPDNIARRAMRVNLSDLAAMGAAPLAFQLAITLQEADETWLESFSAGLLADAEQFQCPLIGGDTTRGALALTLTMMGAVPHGKALLRSGAGVGDLICVTGSLGDAAGGLLALQKGKTEGYLVERYWKPEPRIHMGQQLREIATAALDISDGLLQDAGHIARASGVQATIFKERLPLSSALSGHFGIEKASQLALSGGDDYELCFTLPENRLQACQDIARESGIPVTVIGEMRALEKSDKVIPDWVQCLDNHGQKVTITAGGYDHFK